MRTPGREADGEETKLYTRADVNAKSASTEKSALITKGLGGKNNISDVVCCATRLRVAVHDGSLVNKEMLTASGAAGVIIKGNGVQVIYGPSVTVVKSDLEIYLDSHAGDAEPIKDGEIVYAPISGKVCELTTVGDGVFSEGILGKGAAIEPAEGKVFAPFDGEITMTADTAHALGITSKEGLELLIHVGIDTVELKGNHYSLKVKEGDNVKKGQLLLEFDKDSINKAGYKTITPVVVSNADDFGDISIAASGSVQHGGEFIKVIK